MDVKLEAAEAAHESDSVGARGEGHYGDFERLLEDLVLYLWQSEHSHMAARGISSRFQ